MQAGSDRLDKYGSFATYVELAKLNVIGSTIDEVLKQPARVVYTLLCYEKEKNEFEKQYQKIIHANNK